MPFDNSTSGMFKIETVFQFKQFCNFLHNCNLKICLLPVIYCPKAVHKGTLSDPISPQSHEQSPAPPQSSNARVSNIGPVGRIGSLMGNILRLVHTSCHFFDDGVSPGSSACLKMMLAWPSALTTPRLPGDRLWLFWSGPLEIKVGRVMSFNLAADKLTSKLFWTSFVIMDVEPQIVFHNVPFFFRICVKEGVHFNVKTTQFVTLQYTGKQQRVHVWHTLCGDPREG